MPDEIQRTINENGQIEPIQPTSMPVTDGTTQSETGGSASVPNLVAPLRTYQGDVSAILKKGNGSLVKLAAAEIKRAEEKDRGKLVGPAGPLQYMAKITSTKPGPLPGKMPALEPLATPKIDTAIRSKTPAAPTAQAPNQASQPEIKITKITPADANALSAPKTPKTPFKINLNFILYSLGAILTIAIAFIIWRYWPAPANNVSQQLQITPVVKLESEKEVSISGLNGDGILSQINNVSQIPQRLSVATTIFLTKSVISSDGKTTSVPITAEEFFGTLQIGAPDWFIRTLGDQFSLGYHSFNGNRPFLVFKPKYYQNAFAGMLEWEKTIKHDLSPIFPDLAKNWQAPASTTADALAQKTGFEDLVVGNKDTRVLKKSTGEIYFLYSFPDHNTLILTTNQDTLTKVIKGLISQ